MYCEEDPCPKCGSALEWHDGDEAENWLPGDDPRLICIGCEQEWTFDWERQLRIELDKSGLNLVLLKPERDAMDGKPRSKINECYSCKNNRNIPGNVHIACADADPEMTGKEYGIKNGWFFYPWCFDPLWKTKLCSHYQGVNDA
jgi:hypothetical protein